jgi:phospholipid transport system substrate-binding protein
MSVSRRLTLAGVLLPCLGRLAVAADPEAAAPIAALNRGLIANMQAGKATPFAKRFATLAPLVEGAFDIPGILQASVGPRWAALPPAQQSQLLDVFRRFTVASYVANFDNYDGEKLEVLPDSRNVGADQVVASQIVPASGTPTRIDYVMRRTPAGWRAVDVLLNGSISRVAVQRSDFRSLLGSGDAGPLIQSLQRKIADLSGGALA